MAITALDLGLPGVRAELAGSVHDIDRGEWERIWPRSDEGWDYHRVQEEAGLPGFSFSYLALRGGDGRLALLAPLFTTRFDLALAMPGWLRRQTERLRRVWPSALMPHTLFCGGPTVDRGVVAGCGEAGMAAAFAAAMAASARRLRASLIVLKDLDRETADQLLPLRAHGYVCGTSMPMPVVSTAHDRLDGYFTTLSPATRKDLRRKLRRSERAGGLTVEEATDIAGLEEAIHHLYHQTAHRSQDIFEELTPAFFRGCSRHLGGRALFFLYYAGEGAERRLAGFNLCLRHRDALVDKYIGMDYALLDDHALYFTSFLRNVEWCIANRVPSYRLNYGGEELKRRLGAAMEPRWHLSRFANPLVNRLARLFVPSLEAVA